MGFGASAQSKANDASVQSTAQGLGTLGDTNASRSGFGFKQFKKFLGEAGGYYGDVLNNPMLGAGAGVSSLDVGYGKGQQALQSMMPRGPGQNMAVTENQQNKSNAIANLIQQTQTSAAQGLTGLAGLAEGEQGAAGGLAQSAYGSQMQNLLALNKEELDRQQMTAQLWGSVFQGIGSAAGGFLGGL